MREPVLNVIDRDTCQPMNQSNAKFTVCHKSVTLSGKRGKLAQELCIPSAARRFPRRSTALPFQDRCL